MVTKSFAQATLLTADNTIGEASLSSDIVLGPGEYTTIEELPLSGNRVGDQALVTSTNKLYIWTGSGWYTIALINQTPTWDSNGQPLSTYSLDADSPQQSTVITLLATDPEGFPVSYSAVADANFLSIASISQDSSIFTITPKTESQVPDGGTGYVTFKATDGSNIASSIAEFTLTFLKNFGIIVQNSFVISSTSYNGTGDSRTLSSTITPNHIYIMSNGNGSNNNQMYRASLDSSGAISSTFSNITSSLTWWKQSSNNEYCKVAFYNNGNNAWIMHQSGSVDFKEWKKYSFSTPYDLTTGTYLSSSITFSKGDPYVTLGFRDNGNLFFDGQWTDGVVKYTLSIPYDLTTATEAQSVSSIDGGPYSASTISLDGLSLISDTSSVISERSLSSAFDLTTLSAASSFTVSNAGEYASGYNMSGDKLYRTTWTAPYPVWIASLPRPYRINGYQPSSTLAHSSGTVRAGTMSSDGTRLYTTEYSTGTTRQWNLSTPYDLTSATYINQKASILGNVWHIQLKNDGSVLYMSDNSGQLKSFSITTPYDITTLNTTAISTITMPSATANRYGTFCFTPTGDRLIIASYDSARVYQYTLASPYDITNMTLDGDWSSSYTPVSPRFNATGQKLFLNSISPIKIYEYDLATPYDIITNSPVANGNVFDLRSIDTSNSSFTVEYQPSGEQFFVWGYSTGLVYSVDNTGWPNYQ